MSEWTIAGVLILLCLGQVWALRFGIWRGTVYYMCVSVLGYFSVWWWSTWSTDRLCAAILVGSWLITRSSRQQSSSPAFVVYAWYGITITILGGLFGPASSSDAVSSAYQSWRMPIQVGNWAMAVGVAWVLGGTFAHPGAFLRARPAVLGFATVLCAYAIYQVIAFQSGLPLTGIRRPAGGITAGILGEQFAAYSLNRQVIFRPGALIGEPKGLGAACVFWLAMLFSVGIERRVNRVAAAQAVLLLVTLWFTASTSAWAGALATLGLAGCFLKDRWRFYAIALVTAGFLILAVGGIALSGDELLGHDVFREVAEIAKTRFVDRLNEEGPLGERGEQITIGVLQSKPVLLLFGAGYGGISGYIAEELSGSTDLILFPNNGLLGMISNFGIAGLVLLFCSIWRGVFVMWGNSASNSAEARAMSFVGLSALIQCFIFAQLWLLSFGFGFLLAAEFRRNRELFAFVTCRLRSKSPVRQFAHGSHPRER